MTDRQEKLNYQSIIVNLLKKVIVKIRNITITHVSRWINKRYERKIQKKLCNDNFSIICSNCIGGIIYHRLNKQFLSPTINLWMNQKDFLKMVLHLRDYMEKDLQFIDSEYDYPVALLNDVKIYFNHAKTKEEAEIDWERRKTRINYENLYIIMYDRNGLTDDDYSDLAKVKCENRIVLSTREHPEFSFVKKLKNNPGRINGAQCLDKDIFGIHTFEKQWDFTAWINNHEQQANVDLS